MRHRYPQPGNEDELEEFCLRFYRYSQRCAGLTRYGKRGQRQDGIDLIDQHAISPLLAIQCKLHEPTKTISPKEILVEVAKAEKSLHKVGFYIIATTARKSRDAQDTILELNKR